MAVSGSGFSGRGSSVRRRSSSIAETISVAISFGDTITRRASHLRQGVQESKIELKVCSNLVSNRTESEGPGL